MKTDLLRVLVAIYEAGSVTAAASRLKMSRPAASAALSRLRAPLDDALFVRKGAHMQATPAGAARDRPYSRRHSGYRQRNPA